MQMVCAPAELAVTQELTCYASAALGLSGLVADELRDLGASGVRVQAAGVAFRGSLRTAYRACLESRCASRILLQLARFPAPDANALYAGVRRLEWGAHLGADQTLAVHATGRNAALRHTGFAAQRVKDGVVDWFRDTEGRRPSVDLRQPDIRLHLHLDGRWATLSLDLSGEPLHRRGYRVGGAAAPLKETVAAGLLALLDWPKLAVKGWAFLDPMCGGGTLPIEAALMAAHRAPGLDRPRFGFEGWAGHEPALWAELRREAEARAEKGFESLPPIVGYEAERDTVRAALQAVERAGLRGRVHIERRELQGAEPPGGVGQGLIAVNPPYGERLGERGQLRLLYASLGARLRGRFPGWRAGVLTGDEELGACLGAEPAKRFPMRNGGLRCELLRFEPAPVGSEAPAASAPAVGAPHERTEGAEAFTSRLRKRAKHLGKWARRQGITCYRVYDADLPEYAVAVDRYEDHVHVQEYAPPKTVDPAAAAARLQDVLDVVPEVLGVDPAQVHLKVRRKQTGRGQYVKLGEGGTFHEVHEGGHRFLVNLTDYLDTGLFLDHRLVRARIGELAQGTRFLNLFAYTASATVYAGKAGARSTTSVDLSQTYLGWARRNLSLNGLSERRHRLVRADGLEFLLDAQETWDLIFVDPPTFSNSKALDHDFEVQRDHLQLLQAAGRRLSPRGRIVFSCNFRRFQLDREGLGEWSITDRSRAYLPEDFQRTPRIHQVFELERR